MGHIPVFTGAGAPREQREGWAVREPPLREKERMHGAVRELPLRVVNNEGFSSMGAIYFHSNHGGGRPRGTPLRGMGSGGGEVRGGMGPRMREDNGCAIALCQDGTDGARMREDNGGEGMGSVEEAP